jgi:hypothetical protein
MGINFLMLTLGPQTKQLEPAGKHPVDHFCATGRSGRMLGVSDL